MSRRSTLWRSLPCAGALILGFAVPLPASATTTAAVGGLRLQYRTLYGASSNQLGPVLTLTNTGSAPVPLSAVTIRYWFTADGTASLRYYCDYTPRGCRNVRAGFVRMAGPAPTADTYLELGFAAGAGSLAAGQSAGDLQGRVAKSDWSLFDERNDYSYTASATAPTEWDHVGVYVNGSLVWGVEPGGVPSPHSRAADFTVYGFSQSNVGPTDEDPQVYQLAPDVNIRAFQKWSTSGQHAADYNFAQLARYHDQGIALIGGGTASVIFPEEFPSTAVFDDLSTRDADNLPVPHDEVAAGARRGNLFNPSYRQYLLSWAELQIDGGVDGLFLDEVTGGFSGGTAHNWNGDEGFDDYTIADFNRYLLAKYPGFTAADWTSRFGMTDGNIIRGDVPADDLTRNFNYRTYLRANGWDQNPLTSANPLAAEWGKVTSNRMYAGDSSFTATYTRRYWQELVDALRGYAASTGHGQILITANGLYPFVDFNSVGMYPWNPDQATPDGRGADYVPVVNGQLNGSESLQANYRYLKDQSGRIAGDQVPVTVFIDWPTDMMTAYLNLPLSEQEDYWRIFGAEAYANGIFPAFHLKDTVGDPTAQQQGLLSFLQAYSQFYRDHRTVFRDNQVVTATPSVSIGNVAASLLVQSGTGMRTLHLVNHNYAQALQPQTGFTVSADVGSCPTQISMISPDFAGSKTPPSSCQQGRLTVTVDRLDAYDVLVLS